jgi:hypothetical protein
MTYRYWGSTLVVAAAACQLRCSVAPPRVVAQGYVGERIVRYSWEPSGQRGDEAGRLYALKVRICNQRRDGAETNCMETVILENVQPLLPY